MEELLEEELFEELVEDELEEDELLVVPLPPQPVIPNRNRVPASHKNELRLYMLSAPLIDRAGALPDRLLLL